MRERIRTEIFIRMKNMSAEEARDGDMAAERTTPPPPPPPFLKSISVTNREIAIFWKKKRMNEEDHLLAAIKAAARIRARKLTDEEYRRFKESLQNDDDSEAEDHASKSSMINENEKELRVGIKDWWTKSKYAYLNQPAVGSMDKTKRRASSYISNLCNYKPPSPPTSSFPVF